MFEGGATHLVGIRITDLEVPRKEVADFLLTVKEEERGATLVRAIEIGVLSLERARSGQDLQFVRRQVESLLHQVQGEVTAIPQRTQDLLIAKIGTQEGQVLEPVQRLVDDVSQAASEKIANVQQMLSQEIDPTKETSTLAKALRTLKDLLDPKRSDSIQGSLAATISTVTTTDGALAKAVKSVVADTIAPLTTRIDALTLEFRGKAAEEEALAQTTEKGAPYEDAVLEVLQPWGQAIGAEIHHTGPDNRPGDMVVRVPDLPSGSPLVIVVEVRDRQQPKGRKAISEDLTAAMAERGAQAAIYLSRFRDGLAKEIGEWAEGALEKGPWVACTEDHLITALRMLIVQSKLAARRSESVALDTAFVLAQLQRIRTSLGRIKTINTKVTSVRTSADEIQQETELLRDEIKGALSEIEDAL
ncbi:MAG: hypothetical protein HY613_11970 [Candidatus Rokubacteria bacterium]|nr:hypothetical protein [Candidatus Rokubacteria bacterium]